MYTLLISEDNSIITTKYETLMQRSNFNNIQILIPSLFKGIDISDATLWLKYILPVSKKIRMVRLTLKNSNYRGNFLQYIIPANTLLTAEAGEVEITVTIVKLVYEEDTDTKKAGVETTKVGFIKITPIAQWLNFDPDEMLDPIDQRLIMLEARQKDQDALNQEMFESIARDIVIDKDNNKLKLDSNSGLIGDGVDLNELTTIIETAIVGEDLDGVNDGVTHLDNLQGVHVINLDKLV